MGTDAVGWFRHKVAAMARCRLATVPTPLTSHPLLGGRPVLIKRDDLIGPALGGNKVRKLEFLAAEALAGGADCLLTVGAAQSNHARLTAAVGAMVGLDTHLVLGGRPQSTPTGNQLLEQLFGAILHFPGTDDWDVLESAQNVLAEQLRRRGRVPYAIPIGGSTPVGAVGFAVAFDELMAQCEQQGIRPQLLIHATSSGGTHGGLLAGRAIYLADGRPVPDIVAISVAKTAEDLGPRARDLAIGALEELDLGAVLVPPESVNVHDGGNPGYAVPRADADDALRHAAMAGILLDRVYTAKAFAGLLRLPVDDGDVVFWHTGGQPALFSPGGCPDPHSSHSAEQMRPKEPR